MNIIGKISSPERNKGIYSSQKNLVDDDDTSDDIVVGTLHNVKSVSYTNNAFQIDETNIQFHSNINDQEIKPVEKNDNDLNNRTKSKKIGTDKPHKDRSKKHKNKKQKDDFEMNEIISQESTLSPSMSSSISENDENSKFVHSNNFEDVLVIKKSMNFNEDKGPNDLYDLKMKVKRKLKHQKTTDTNSYGEIDNNVENYQDSDASNDIKIKKTHEIEISNNVQIIGVHILKSDVLENHLYLYKPFVRVYILDNQSSLIISTGDSKLNKNENHVAVTKSYDFCTRRKIVPEWDEILMFNSELINKIKSPENVIIFFEILDEIVTTDKIGSSTNFTSLCWAFIKPLGNDLSSNLNKKLNLQLYEVGPTDIHQNKVNVYEWWKSKPWIKYPSTFNVVVMSLYKNTMDDSMNIIKHAIYHTNNIDDKTNQSMNKYITKFKALTFEKLKLENRSSTEEIEIPNKIVSILNNNEGSTTILKFSNCGKYLAYSALENHKYFIFIYKIPEFEEIMKLSHHKGLIYDICWNKQTSRLLSASADNFVYIWSISESSKWNRKKLHHPSFVYAAKFCKLNENIIVTGCYDKIVRIWISNLNSEDEKYTLSEELIGHTGYVNTICFMDHNEIFFSGDSEGNILKWAKGHDGWVKILATDIEEFKGKIINDLQLFPDNRSMLVVLRNSPSWTINLTTMSTFTCYKNGIPNRYQIRGCISPCGSFVFISNNIWTCSTGKLCAIYNPTQFDHHPIMSLDYHPLYNLIAMSCDRKGIPIILCYHIHTQTIDLNLGVEIYMPDVFNCKKIGRTDSIPKNKFKNVVNKKMEEFEVNATSNKNKQSKLWDLLRKMDDLLLKAKESDDLTDDHISTMHKQEAKINTVLEKLSYRKKAASTENESESTVSANLTDFYERMNKISLRNLEASSSQTESDMSNNLGTYTLENEKPKIKKKKKKNIDNCNENGESSTLSNAESLEDDQNTYTILTKEKNI